MKTGHQIFHQRKYKSRLTFQTLTGKRILLLVLGTSFLLNMAYGAQVDSVTAKTVARNFLSSRLLQSSLKQTRDVDAEIFLAYQEALDSSVEGAFSREDQISPLYYVFNVEDDLGFVIVSGDDRVAPVLGYSFTGSFRLTDQPPAFKEWMNHLREQLKFLIENNTDSDKSILEKWNRLSNLPTTKSVEQSYDVLPLLSTAWDQGCYYNELCPADNGGPCDRAYAGCVATAMGQIMKFWNHPVSSTRISGYDTDSDYGCLPDIAPTSFNWSSMPDELNYGSTNEEIQAVSELLYNAGVACYMEYSADGSGALSTDARNALVSYFSYSSDMQYRMKMSADEETWMGLLRDELDNGRPILYSGQGSIGHAFVCDGYQGTDYFHFNWGWSGALNGYFLLTDLTPGNESFNNFQSAIIGISPEASQADPYDQILEIEGTGAGNTQTYTGSGAGAWDLSTCDSYTPGAEQVYSFVPSASGYYSIEVLAAGSEISYSWRQADCGDPGWRCIEQTSSTGSFGNYFWTAGSTYHILLDDVNTASSTHQFYIDLTALASPDIGYLSHTFDDDNTGSSSGDGDGIAEAGESLEISLTLENTGEGLARNVTADLATTDPHISIGSADTGFGDIAAGSNALSAGDYVIHISPDCPEKEVTFTLDINSEDGHWTDQFTLEVYINAPPAPKLEYFTHQIDDNTSSGDNDGLAEGGELINMPITLVNSGDDDASNVSAVLSAVDPLISIVTGSNSFYNIPAGGTAQSSGNYSFQISADCPDKIVAFSLDITSDEGSWTSQFIVQVEANPTSIGYYRDNLGFVLFPNPARDILYLKPGMVTEGSSEIRILDSKGRMLRIQTVPALLKDEVIEIELTDFDKGMYFVQFVHSSLSSTRKIIVD